jgi:phosphatidylinositol alpha-1,6-mannosyltransferase
MLWWLPPFLLLVWLERLGVAKMDKILVLSEEIRRIMRRAYGVDSSVVRSGPDLIYLDRNAKGSLQDPSLWRASHGIRTRNLILTVGRLEAIKRFDLLIAAARLISRRRNDFTIVIAGAGPQENRLRRLVALSNLDDVVRIVGQVSEEDLYNWYNACDMFVFPSWCPWGLVVLEAMYFQKPCVVSRCAGVSEVLEDQVNAMITGASVEDTANAISKLLEEPSLARSLGSKGEKLVRQRYNFANYTQECLEVLRTAASS